MHFQAAQKEAIKKIRAEFQEVDSFEMEEELM